MPQLRTTRRIALTLLAGAMICAGAQGQLRQRQVLVVYDSRIADSLAVAEYYAGSHNVPGGAGNLRGSRPGVRAFDLASVSAPSAAGPDISYSTFISALRDPIRAWLTANDPRQDIRSIVLTKGLAHRVQDINDATLGDRPLDLTTPWNAGNVHYCAVDSELVLLWQNLDAFNAPNNPTVRKSAGIIVNPYWKSTTTIATTARTNITAQKTFFAATAPYVAGQVWRIAGSTPQTPGDMYLVCRLDGYSTGYVRDIIDRARTGYLNVSTSTIVLDESRSNGSVDANVTNGSGSASSQWGELDNQDFTNVSATNYLWAGDDYELTRNWLTITDKRWLSSSVVYNAQSGANQFISGPNVNALGPIISTPVALVASEGSNAEPFNAISVSPILGSTFTYAPMSVYNTIESYNARSFGGLGPVFRQSQLIDALASGCTFAVGQVYEPYSATVPDNLYLVQNFLMGNLSWAEAAYSALPALSWQQIVLGDPLARVKRSSEDVNNDGDVDINDLYTWERTPSDINRSGVADQTDKRFIENALRSGEFQDLRGRQR